PGTPRLRAGPPFLAAVPPRLASERPLDRVELLPRVDVADDQMPQPLERQDVEPPVGRSRVGHEEPLEPAQAAEVAERREAEQPLEHEVAHAVRHCVEVLDVPERAERECLEALALPKRLEV